MRPVQLDGELQELFTIEYGVLENQIRQLTGRKQFSVIANLECSNDSYTMVGLDDSSSSYYLEHTKPEVESWLAQGQAPCVYCRATGKVNYGGPDQVCYSCHGEGMIDVEKQTEPGISEILTYLVSEGKLEEPPRPNILIDVSW